MEAGMAVEDELDLAPDVSTPPAWLNPETERTTEEPGFVSDLGNAVAAGAYGLASGVGGAAEYVGGLVSDATGIEKAPETRGERLKKWGQEGAQAATARMSKQSQREAAAGVLPNAEGSDIFDADVSALRALSLKTAMSIPSLVATIVPGTVVARGLVAAGAGRAAAAAAGTGAAGSTGATLSAGGVFEEIQSEYRRMSDADLQTQIEPYAILRQDGMSEAEARKKLEEYVIGSKPFIMAAITAGTSAFGLEKLASGLAAGVVTKGVARNAARGAVGEGVQETLESGSESVLTQKGKKDIRGQEVDWFDVLDKAVEGGVIGGVLGGGTGAAFGGRSKETARPDDAASPPATTDSALEQPPPPAALPQSAPDGSTVTTLANGTVQPPTGAPATVIGGLEEDVDFFQDEPVDPSVAAALRAPAETVEAPNGVDVDVASVGVPAANATPSVDQITADVVQQATAQAAQLPPTGNVPMGAVAEPVAAPVAEPVVAEPVTVEPQPRVLPSITAEAQEAERRFREDWARKGAETRAALREEGELPTRQRIRDTNAIDGEGIEKMERRKWVAAARRIAEAQGDNTPEPVRATVQIADAMEGFTPKDPRRVQLSKVLDDLKTKAATHYKGVTAERKATVEKNFDSREATQGVTEGAGAKVRQTLKRRAEKVQDSAKDIVTSGDSYPDEMVSDVNRRSKALAKRLGEKLAAAKEQGVAIPSKVTADTPLYQNVLKRYKDAIQNLNSRRVPKGYDNFADYVADIQTDELMARKGKPEEVAERFRVEGSLRGDDGAQIADVAEEPAQEEIAAPVPRERPAPPVKDDGVAPVYGAAKKAAVIEVAKKRTFTPQGKPATPTPAQAVAGNYKKGRAFPFGFQMSVETAKGQTRSGTASDGTPWSVKMPVDYGYIRRTTGADGEQIDVYLGPGRTTDAAPLVYIVNQMDPDTKKFDEHKVLLGFRDEDSAVDAYEAGFSDGSGASRIKSIDIMTVEEFRTWMKKPRTVEATSDTTILPSAPEGWAGVEAGVDESMIRELLTDPLDDTSKIAAAATKTSTLGNVLAAERLRAGTFSNSNMHGIIAPVAEAIRRVASNVKVHYLDESDIMRVPFVLKAIEEGVLSRAPKGFYDPVSDTIVLNNRTSFSSNREDMYQLAVHEGLHAVLAQVIHSSPRFNTQLGNLLNEVRGAVATQMKRGELPVQNIYGLTNEHEFLSEAMSNPEFQDILASIQVPEKYNQGVPQSYWDRFISYARQIFSYVTGSTVPSNALEAAIRMTARGFDIADQVGRLDQYGRAAYFSAAAPIVDRARATGGWMRRFGYYFSTLDYIRQMNRGLFTDDKGDALDKVVSLMQRITPRARELRKTSEALAVDFLTWGAKNPEQARNMADLAVDATMLNVNLVDDPAASTNGALDAANTHLGKDAVRGWQAKANLREMQGRFMKLPPEARKLWVDQANYYRDTQNKVARTTVNSLLEAVADKLTPQQRQDLVDKTMAGTLGDVEKTLLGDNAVFSNLSNAAVLRTIDGVYFPLMRYGGHVVKTRLKWGDLMGGKELNHNTVEFRAPKDKDARSAAKAFVAKTDLPVSSVKRVYYERTTGQQLSADDAKGQDVDVGYRVIVQRDGVFMFDTATEAEAFRREEGDSFDQLSGVMPKADYNTDTTLSAAQLSSLMSAVRGMSDSKVSAARKTEIEQALHQAAARMLPGNRIQKRTIKRKNVVGASHDLGRALLSYGQSSSGYLARAEFMPQLREGLARMRAIQADKTEISADAVPRSLTIKEIERRIAGNVETVYEPNKFVANLLTISFLDKLFSPAYSLLNAMQVQMTSYPYLAGRFGEAKSAMQLARAYGAVGLGNITMDGIGNTAKALKQVRQVALDTRDIAKSVRDRVATQSDGKQLTEVLNTLRERGALDDGAAFELAQAVESGAGRTTTALARVDRIARQLPMAVEQLNRSVVAIASYRLATQQGKSHEAAVQFAFDTVMLTQFDYSNINSSTMFNNGLARLALQFKKYAASMAVLLYDMTRQAFRGASVEERKAGRRQLANIIAVQMVTAGALSLPGLELIKVFGLIAGALGLGGGYDDLERWLRGVAKEAMGEKTAELMLRGFSRALGIDLSTRLSLADMFLFGEPKDYSQEGIQAYMFRLASGAPIGFVMDMFAASNHALDGDSAKTVEKLIPFKVISDTAKAINKYRAGDYNAAEAGAQAFGLRPASAARKSEEIGDAIAKKQDQQTKRKRLERQYLNGSAEDRKRLMADMKEYNKDANWREKISFGALNRRLKAQEDKRAGRPNPDNK